MDPVVLPKMILDCTVMTVMFPRARSPAPAGPATLSHHMGAPHGGFNPPGLRLHRLPGALAGAGAGNDVGLPSERCALVETRNHGATMQKSCRRQCATYGNDQGFCSDRPGQKAKCYIAGKEGWLHPDEWRLETPKMREVGNL